MDDADGEGCGDQAIAQAPRGMPSPCAPTADEVAKHCLTHLPYRSWCKFCVSGKRPNAAHTKLPGHSREIPLLAADYCFLRDERDQDTLTCLVARLYPWRALISIPCDVKGFDEYAVGRLTDFIRNAGVTRMVHMTDQETALGSMIQASMEKLGGSSTWAGSVREVSAVGESQSNGKAEASVKAVEDQLRVMKGALESRTGARIPSQHPVMKWMVEYASVLLNKYSIQADGKTSYHALHGKKVSERIVEFGETVMHYIPKKRRSKLDMRWATGVFLGTTMHSNESYIGLSNGSVVRGRAITRVRPDQRWSKDLIQKIRGTPAEPLSRDDSEVETFENPHDHEPQPDGEVVESKGKDRAALRRRIRAIDIVKHGPSPNCPRCRAQTTNNPNYNNYNHTEKCRERFYRLMEESVNRKIVEDIPNVEVADDAPVVEGAGDFEPEVDVDVAPSTPGAEPDFDELDADLIDELMRDDPVEDPQYGMDIDLLLSLGVEPADACKIVNGLCARSPL